MGLIRRMCRRGRSRQRAEGSSQRAAVRGQQSEVSSQRAEGRGQIFLFMKAPLHRIAARLRAEPWLMRQDKYQAMCSQFRAAAGERDVVGATYWEPERNPFNNALRLTAVNCLERVEMLHGIAILPVEGILAKNLNTLEAECGGYDVNVLAMQAIALQSRPEVHTVILHLNTPGGAAAGIADCGEVLLQLAGQKRVIAYADEACSGGYWLACAAHAIYAGESAIVGSISAMCAFEDVSKMYEEAGVKVEAFSDGDLKTAGLEGTSLTDAQRESIQGRIEYIGGRFKSFVKSRRAGVTDDAMRGQWFYGEQAVDAGLLDGLAPTIQHVIAAVLASD